MPIAKSTAPPRNFATTDAKVTQSRKFFCGGTVFELPPVSGCRPVSYRPLRTRPPPGASACTQERPSACGRISWAGRPLIRHSQDLGRARDRLELGRYREMDQEVYRNEHCGH